MLVLVAWQAVWNEYKAHFTWGVKAKVQLKSSIPIGAKVEITLRLKPLNQVKGWSHYFKMKEAACYAMQQGFKELWTTFILVVSDSSSSMKFDSHH
jgi:hypothetical protein